MGFSFDLEECDPRPPGEPEIRRIDGPRFSASVGRLRPELDSEPALDSERMLLAPAEPESEEPPVDFPAPEGTKLAPNDSPRPHELLGAIRRAFRTGAPPRPTLASTRRGEAINDRPALAAPVRRARKSERKLLGPLAACAALGLTYLISTSSLVALGPRLARSSTRVPDLGSLESKKDAPTPSSAPGPTPAAPEPPQEKKALIETGPLPEGLSYPGKGLIEVVTSERELIYVDSIFLGRGPLRRVPVLPGEHAIKIRSGGTERDASAVVRAAETTRIHFEADPHLVGPDGTKADPEELD